MKHVMITILLGALLNAPTLFAHGEDTPGPHGGFIKMPGAFHTELVPDEKKGVKIYLLDFKFRNPVTEDSSVSVKFVSKGKTLDTTCTPQVDFFSCRLPIDFKSAVDGKLIVTAKREGAKGVPATYKLPLKRK